MCKVTLYMSTPQLQQARARFVASIWLLITLCFFYHFQKISLLEMQCFSRHFFHSGLLTQPAHHFPIWYTYLACKITSGRDRSLCVLPPVCCWSHFCLLTVTTKLMTSILEEKKPGSNWKLQELGWSSSKAVLILFVKCLQSVPFLFLNFRYLFLNVLLWNVSLYLCWASLQLSSKISFKFSLI